MKTSSAVSLHRRSRKNASRENHMRGSWDESIPSNGNFRAPDTPWCSTFPWNLKLLTLNSSLQGRRILPQGKWIEGRLWHPSCKSKQRESGSIDNTHDLTRWQWIESAQTADTPQNAKTHPTVRGSMRNQVPLMDVETEGWMLTWKHIETCQFHATEATCHASLARYIRVAATLGQMSLARWVGSNREQWLWQKQQTSRASCDLCL